MLQQPMAIAIRKVGKLYEIRDSVTFRPIPVWLVVVCPDGEVFFGPKSSYNRENNGSKAVKPKNRLVKYGPRDHFGVAVGRGLDQYIIERIRGMFDDDEN